MLRSPTPRQRATATSNGWERESQPYPRVCWCSNAERSSWKLYTHRPPRRTQHIVFIYLLIHTHKYIYAYNNNLKRCYQLEGGMEGLEGGYLEGLEGRREEEEVTHSYFN